MTQIAGYGSYDVYLGPHFDARCGGLMLIGDQRAAIERHVAKLAYFPEAGESPCGLTLDYDWIDEKSQGGIVLPALPRIGVLRIDETIGGHDSLAVTFFIADSKLDGQVRKRIWALWVSQSFNGQLDDFAKIASRGACNVVLERHYSGA